MDATHDETTEGSEFELGTKSGDCEIILDCDLESRLGGPSQSLRVSRSLEEAGEEQRLGRVSLGKKWGRRRATREGSPMQLLGELAPRRSLEDVDLVHRER